jgi:stringent starvation protein B
MEKTSTKGYLLRALHEWCTDNGYTPHIAVRCDARTRVPHEFIRDGEIVLNIGYQATHQLKMSNDWIEFTARFSGRPQKVEVPVANVLAIYARENGEGMAFPLEEASSQEEDELHTADGWPENSRELVEDPASSSSAEPPKVAKSHLRVVK